MKNQNKTLIYNIKSNLINSLNLSGNEISDEGAKAISEALKVNTSVTNLDLSYATIGYEGAKAIAEALKVNTTITSLDIVANQIGAAEAKDIVDSIERNVDLLKKCANEALNNIDATDEVLNINDLMRLTKCDKHLLKTLITEEGANQLIKKYLAPNYFNYNAFKIIGVCNEVSSTSKSPEGMHISDLPPEVISLIMSFLSPCDFIVREVNPDIQEVSIAGSTEIA